jgi:sporulation-control protein
VVFKKMMRAFGAGGPTVDTVLSNPNTRPGLAFDGEVNIVGGGHDVAIEHVALGLVTRVESEHGDGFVEFHRLPVAGAFRLSKGERRDIPFSFLVPWETPITDVYGQRLHGMTMGLRTELAVAKAVDKGDLDEVAVHPLPAQEKILEAFAGLGFRFARADLEHGALYGVRQTLPFYQEIEFYPPAQHSGVVGEIELTFVADSSGLEVILEADKRSGRYSSGDAIGRFQVGHDEAMRIDWPSEIDRWLAGLVQHGHHGYSRADHHAHSSQHYGHHESHHDGPGWGAVAAAGAAGLVGGFVASEIAEEIFEGDDEGSGDSDW